MAVLPEDCAPGKRPAEQMPTPPITQKGNTRTCKLRRRGDLLLRAPLPEEVLLWLRWTATERLRDCLLCWKLSVDLFVIARCRAWCCKVRDANGVEILASSVM